MCKPYLSIIAAAFLGCAGGPLSADELASQAYQLRMQGKVDQARDLLEEHVTDHPDDAAAHFELARIHMHIALGNPSDFDQQFAKARKAIDLAVSLEPQQVSYQCFAGHVAYFQTYYAMQLGKPGLQEHFSSASRAWEAALKIKPDHRQALLYLVELHGAFPSGSGSDRSKAEAYAKRLEGIDKLYAAKATSILSPESCDVDFWKALLSDDDTNASDVLEELGKAHLRQDQIAEAEAAFEQAIEGDPTKTYLHLDLSIYHTFRALRSRGKDENVFESSLAAGDKAIGKYLDSAPSLPMKAYALGVKSKYSAASGDAAAAKALVDRGNALDSYFSKATGAPHPDLFSPISVVSDKHRYLLRPF